VQSLAKRFICDRCFDFLNILSKKFSEKIGVFLTQNKAKICKILIITLVFDKNANFFAENCQKSQKIVIVTSTPDAKKGKVSFNLRCPRRFTCGKYDVATSESANK
jgi:predicted dinucleotide-binding enzyme